MLTVHLPEDLEGYLEAEVQGVRFASANEAIATAIGLLRPEDQAVQSQRGPRLADEVNRQLLKVGLLSRIPARPDPATYEEFSPIVVEGEPLSDTIICERR